MGRHDDGGGECMEQNLDVGLRHELVGGDLEGRNIVRLRLDLVADSKVRRVQPVHRLQTVEDVVGNAVNDLLVAAVYNRVQPAKRAQSRRGSGAAQKAVALDQDRRAAAATG